MCVSNLCIYVNIYAYIKVHVNYRGIHILQSFLQI